MNLFSKNISTWIFYPGYFITIIISPPSVTYIYFHQQCSIYPTLHFTGMFFSFRCIYFIFWFSPLTFTPFSVISLLEWFLFVPIILLFRVFPLQRLVEAFPFPISSILFHSSVLPVRLYS